MAAAGVISNDPADRLSVRPVSSRRSSSQSAHSHSHSHSHAYAPARNGHSNAEGASSDRGARITLIGLAVNVGSTAVKAVAGYALNSAALTADAAHSMSDLLGDFVVLVCWKLSRRPPSKRYPFGYGKYESVGSLLVSILLVLGAAGIATHSYHLLSPFIWSSPTSTVAASSTLSHSHSHTQSHSHSHSHSYSHSHSHSHSDELDPNAAWFALASVLIKEWLYHATMRVAKEEHSNVLEANALHHRSDAFSGIIALIAIATSSFGLSLADPAGGLVVAVMILRQGLQLALSSITELLDQASDPALAENLTHFLDASPEFPELTTRSIKSIRNYKSGAYEIVILDLNLSSVEATLQRRLESIISEWSESDVEVAVRLQ